MSYLGVPEVGDLGLDVVHLHLVRGVEEHGDHPVRLLDPLDAGHRSSPGPTLVSHSDVGGVEDGSECRTKVSSFVLMPVLLVKHSPHTN